MLIDYFNIDGQIYEVKTTRNITKEGTLHYRCELNGTTISTFAYNKNYEGSTHEEALNKIAFELRRALNALAEI